MQFLDSVGIVLLSVGMESCEMRYSGYLSTVLDGLYWTVVYLTVMHYSLLSFCVLDYGKIL